MLLPIPTEENRLFSKEILKYPKLGLIKQQIIGNKQYHLRQAIILRHKIG
jgi:hypothetical protein